MHLIRGESQPLRRDWGRVTYLDVQRLANIADKLPVRHRAHFSFDQRTELEYVRELFRNNQSHSFVSMEMMLLGNYSLTNLSASCLCSASNFVSIRRVV